MEGEEGEEASLACHRDGAAMFDSDAMKKIADEIVKFLTMRSFDFDVFTSAGSDKSHKMEGEKGGEASLACDRDWAELPRDVLMVIFLKIGLFDVLTCAGSVCRSWRKVAKEEPDLWRKIDMTNKVSNSPAGQVSHVAKLAIDRSMGQLEEFSLVYGEDSILQHLCARTSVLKKLSLSYCFLLSSDTIVETAKRQPLLEEIRIHLGKCDGKAIEILGKQCPQMKIFKFNVPPYILIHDLDNDAAALAIAKTMPQLTDLQLVGNMMTNEGLKAILDGCLHLETLDIRRCSNVNMDANLWARCAKLKTIRLPGDSVDDCEFDPDDDLGDIYDYDEYDYDLEG